MRRRSARGRWTALVVAGVVLAAPAYARAAELGVSNQELGYVVSALVDGALASEYRHNGDEIDLKIIAEGDLARRTHLIEDIPVATPSGQRFGMTAAASAAWARARL